MLVQIPPIIASVTTVVAGKQLLAAWLGPGLLGGGLQVEGEEGRRVGRSTGGGLSSNTVRGLGRSHTGGGLGRSTGPASELDHGIVLQLFLQLCSLPERPACRRGAERLGDVVVGRCGGGLEKAGMWAGQLPSLWQELWAYKHVYFVNQAMY